MTENSTQENTEIVADDELDPPNDLPTPAPHAMPSQETPLCCSTQTRTTLIRWGFNKTEASGELSIAGLLGLVGMHHKAQYVMAFAATDEETPILYFWDPLAFQAMTKNYPELTSYVDELSGQEWEGFFEAMWNKIEQLESKIM